MKRIIFVALTAMLPAPSAGLRCAEARYGADANDTGNPIGGGKGYSRMLTSGDVRVSTTEQLKAALKTAKRGEVVFITAAQLDLTSVPLLQLPEGVTLAGCRGHNASPGVVIRGIPLEGDDVHHNWFVHHADPARICQQRNATGNCRVRDNVHGPDRKPVPEALFQKHAGRVIITP